MRVLSGRRLDVDSCGAKGLWTEFKGPGARQWSLRLHLRCWALVSHWGTLCSHGETTRKEVKSANATQHDTSRALCK